GSQWMSWIHLDDLVRLIVFAIEKTSLSGAINAVAPGPVTHREFMRSLGRCFGRQVRFVVPGKALAFALGDLSSLFLASQRVLPMAAAQRNFQFRFGTLDAALADLFNRGNQVGPTIYVNDTCPICAGEFGHYKAVACRSGAALEVRNISDAPNDLKPYGIAEADLRRRLHIADTDGRVVTGLEALIVVWSRLPYYRWLARLVRLPGAHQVMDALYEGVLVPVL